MCSVENCSNKVNAKGLCANHYRAMRKFGDPLGVSQKHLEASFKVCSVEGCGKAKKSKRLCGMHDNRMRRHGSLETPVRVRKMKETCQVISDGRQCPKPEQARGMCQMHYRRWSLYNDVNQVYRPKNENLQKRYVRVLAPGHPNSTTRGFILEHRLIMSEMIGRPLRDFENVHHKNGDRQDNRPENLELWNKSQPAGQRVEDKINWALELISFYAPHHLKEDKND